MKPHRVLLVDDHAMFRQGLSCLLKDVEDIDVVGEACGREEAQRQMRDLRPDVVVIIASLLMGDGTNGPRALRAEAPEVKILVLTAPEEDGDVLNVLSADADGYVAKSAPADMLIRSIRKVIAGEGVPSRRAMRPGTGLAESARQSDRRSPRSHDLSERERQVLRIVATGADNRQIASILGVSESTVRGYMHNVLDKLGLETRLQVALYALQQGIYP